MKKRICNLLAAFVLVGAFLFAALCLSLFKSNGFVWMNRVSLTDSRGLDFARRRLMADARTIVAAVRFLYDVSQTPGPSDAMVVSKLPDRLLLQTRLPGNPHSGPGATNTQGA